MHAEVRPFLLLLSFQSRAKSLPTLKELLSHVLRATKERLEAQGVDVNGGAVQDIHNGTVLMELGGAKSGRLASLDAGYVLNPLYTGNKVR